MDTGWRMMDAWLLAVGCRLLAVCYFLKKFNITTESGCNITTIIRLVNYLTHNHYGYIEDKYHFTGIQREARRPSCSSLGREYSFIKETKHPTSEVEQVAESKQKAFW